MSAASECPSSATVTLIADIHWKYPETWGIHVYRMWAGEKYNSRAEGCSRLGWILRVEPLAELTKPTRFVTWGGGP